MKRHMKMRSAFSFVVLLLAILPWSASPKTKKQKASEETSVVHASTVEKQGAVEIIAEGAVKTNPVNLKVLEIVEAAYKGKDANPTCKTMKVTPRKDPKTGKLITQKDLPKEFVQGVALTYMRTVCRSTSGDPIKKLLMSKPPAPGYAGKDILEVPKYNEGFVNEDGPRHIINNFKNLLALASEESDGDPLEGPDKIKHKYNSTPAGEESGPYQVSANSQTELIKPLFKQYFGLIKQAHGDIQQLERICFLSTFTGDASQKEQLLDTFERLRNVAEQILGGSTEQLDPDEFKEAMKTCPALATEYVAVLARTNKGANGPFRRETIDSGPGCRTMFENIEQTLQSDDPFALCSQLNDVVVSPPKEY